MGLPVNQQNPSYHTTPRRVDIALMKTQESACHPKRRSSLVSICQFNIHHGGTRKCHLYTDNILIHTNGITIVTTETANLIHCWEKISYINHVFYVL